MEKKKEADYIGIGLVFGTAIGIAMDNLGVGISMGIAIGAAIAYSKQEKNKE